MYCVCNEYSILHGGKIFKHFLKYFSLEKQKRKALKKDREQSSAANHRIKDNIVRETYSKFIRSYAYLGYQDTNENYIRRLSLGGGRRKPPLILFILHLKINHQLFQSTLQHPAFLLTHILQNKRNHILMKPFMVPVSLHAALCQ